MSKPSGKSSRGAWNGGGIRTRHSGIRKERDKILIVCEGTKTEPSYFKAFPQSEVMFDTVVAGLGYNSKSLVLEAIRLKTEHAEAPFNQVWCVFDRDLHRQGQASNAQQFNEALRLAAANRCHVAYSNDAFELWYLLHYEYTDSALSRDTYSSRLSNHLRLPYRKNSPDIYERLKDKMKDGIRNATKLLATYVPHVPAKDNPCTTVHKLVQRLLVLE